MPRWPRSSMRWWQRALEHAGTVMPGFTHLQTAQPVTFGHHLLAYVEMAARDRGRFADARKRLNESPLGAAALAGTSFPIDRDATAKALGFDRPMANSLDAVSDRDFVLETLSAAAIASVHLSRFAEEIVIWTSPLVGLVRLSDKFTTGSSIMPQKRNPDAAELVRAKTGRVIGALTALLIVMKGLPLAYQKDMQEDKQGAMEAFGALSLAVRAMTGMVLDLVPDQARMKAAAGEGYATATDLADWLVRTLKMPFRDAHHVTGRIVAKASKEGVALHELPLAGDAGDRAEDHRGGAGGAVGRSLGEKPRPAMAAPRRRTCWRRPRPGSSGWKKSENWAEPRFASAISSLSGSRQSRAIFVWCGRFGDIAVNRNSSPCLAEMGHRPAGRRRAGAGRLRPQGPARPAADRTVAVVATCRRRTDTEAAAGGHAERVQSDLRHAMRRRPPQRQQEDRSFSIRSSKQLSRAPP